MGFLDKVVLEITVSSFLTYGFLFLIALFILILVKISMNKDTTFHLIDLISNTDGTASLSKILQLSAGVTATWVIIQSTIGKWLSVELFTTYLVALGVSEGFSKWIKSKNANEQDKDTK